jgi:hypothetical protein
VLVSRQKLPLIIYDDIQKTHEELEAKFSKKLSQSIIGIEEIDEFEFYSSLSKYGLKLSLAGKQEINKRNLRKAMRIKSFSRSIKQNFERLSSFVEKRQIDGIDTTVQNIIDHLETFELASNVLSQVILLAFHNGIINQQLDD